jgi:hypothetical protein
LQHFLCQFRNDIVFLGKLGFQRRRFACANLLAMLLSPLGFIVLIQKGLLRFQTVACAN